MVRVMSKVALAAVCMLALAVFTQQAKAGTADFSCSGAANCNGQVVASSGNFSSTGISLVAGSSFTIPVGDTDEGGEGFTLAFDTASHSITLTDSTDSDATLTGTITSFSTAGGSVFMTVVWSVPSGYISNPSFVIVQTSGSISGCTGKGCAAFSVDVPVLPSPEPASLMLLGTGLLGMGAAVRRRLL